ncbi:MAG: prenyltransferase/squalene oxidase repeat-containing protein [Planctomycetota bacterium]
MSLRQAMLAAARRAPRLLGSSARLVADCARRQLKPDGGFRGRSPASDLYYTVFALETLLALDAPVPRHAVRGYLAEFAEGEGLDFVHLCCLARCWADLDGGPPDGTAEAVLQRLAAFQAADGGFAQSPGAKHGAAYGCFLGLGALEDCRSGSRPSGRSSIPDSPLISAKALVECLRALETGDGGYANAPGLPASTPATAAAAVVLHHLAQPVSEATADWLLARCGDPGGFAAAPSAPVPDLLSTATALHALGGLGVPLDAVRERCLAFLDSLWDARGGFHGSWADDALDCEYTFYGLLALGHLAPLGPAASTPSPRGRG